jgi:hypothetical protein
MPTRSINITFDTELRYNKDEKLLQIYLYDDLLITYNYNFNLNLFQVEEINEKLLSFYLWDEEGENILSLRLELSDYDKKDAIITLTNNIHWLFFLTDK